jgi:hypothetical protein
MQIMLLSLSHSKETGYKVSKKSVTLEGAKKIGHQGLRFCSSER